MGLYLLRSEVDPADAEAVEPKLRDIQVDLKYEDGVQHVILNGEDVSGDEAVHTAAELTGLKDTIESMERGYDTRCTDDLFSQGQWQLLSIARAAAAAPSMLLFDEITASLDAETERAVLSALKRVAENRTVISISHRTSAELSRIIALTD